MKLTARQDVLLAAYAVSLGFEILDHQGGKLTPDAFAPDGRPANGLTFKRSLSLLGATKVLVWETDRGWRVARMIDGYYEKAEPHQFYTRLKDALDVAKAF